uniref:Uncharacterized protein n=1 Tax=viral metagenome TaxID=1070528 RepID=A0A6C0LQ53_9ZZZZ
MEHLLFYKQKKDFLKNELLYILQIKSEQLDKLVEYIDLCNKNLSYYNSECTDCLFSCLKCFPIKSYNNNECPSICICPQKNNIKQYSTKPIIITETDLEENDYIGLANFNLFEI